MNASTAQRALSVSPTSASSSPAERAFADGVEVQPGDVLEQAVPRRVAGQVGLDRRHQTLEVVGGQAAHPAEPRLASSQLRDDAAHVERVWVPAEERHAVPTACRKVRTDSKYVRPSLTRPFTHRGRSFPARAAAPPAGRPSRTPPTLHLHSGHAPARRARRPPDRTRPRPAGRPSRAPQRPRPAPRAGRAWNAVATMARDAGRVAQGLGQGVGVAVGAERHQRHQRPAAGLHRRGRQQRAKGLRVVGRVDQGRHAVDLVLLEPPAHVEPDLAALRRRRQVELLVRPQGGLPGERRLACRNGGRALPSVAPPAATSSRRTPSRSASSRRPGRQRVVEPAGQHQRAGRGDGQLLGQDVLPGRPEELGVVEVDAGQHDELRQQRARGVEPAAEPGLDDRHVDPGVGQERLAGQRQQVEEAQVGRVLGLAGEGGQLADPGRQRPRPAAARRRPARARPSSRCAAR